MLTPDNSKYSNERKHYVINGLSGYENHNQLCTIDYKLTKKEVLSACQLLKNNNASS